MTTEIALRDRFPVLAPNSEAAQVLAENMGGEKISPSDLMQIKTPSGGATAWAVPQIDGTEKHEPSIEGIIVAFMRRRAYWSSSDPSGTPPDCSSQDCVTGVGDPGGPCETCPLNEWGTARKQDGSDGSGKACKERSLVFVLREGDVLPIVVRVSPGSLRAFREYRLKLPVPYYACVTRLGLTKEKNKDGISFAKLAPRFVAAVPKDEVEAIRKYAAVMAATFGAAADAAARSGEGD